MGRMGRMPRAGRAVPASALMLGLLLGAMPAAAAWEGALGWTRTDAGLQKERDGLSLGIAGRTPLAAGPLRLVYALDYVQKRGAQPTLFYDATAAFTTADAEVTLHSLQPTVACEFDAGAGRLPRPYVGLALGIKLSETWSDFPGTPNVAYGYRDVDGVLLVGVAQRVGPLGVDLRYGVGLADQLLIDTSGTSQLPGAKAAAPVDGAEAPEVGARVSYLQAGVRVAF